MPARLQRCLQLAPTFLSLLCIGKVSAEDDGAQLRGGRRATASNVSDVSADVASFLGDAQCRTVTKDSHSPADGECYEHVVSELYPGATMPGLFGSPVPATFEGIQNQFHERKQWLCPKPCPPCSVRVYSYPSFEDYFTVRYGECVPDGAGGSLIANGALVSGASLCTSVHYAVFKHFDNRHCSDVFAPPQTWTVFTDGDTSYNCRNKTGHLVGKCGGRDTFLGWAASAPGEYFLAAGGWSCTQACQARSQNCSGKALADAASSVAECKRIIEGLGFSPEKGGQYPDDNSGCTYHPGQTGWYQVMRKDGEPECSAVNADSQRERVCACS